MPYRFNRRQALDRVPATAAAAPLPPLSRWTRTRSGGRTATLGG
ncbi:hypothetical protein ACQP1P_16970 [Dactylosporangium sp. CA-052675]